jgi:PAS domain S-box-containing protein
MFSYTIIFSVCALLAVMASTLVFALCFLNWQLVGAKSLACMMAAVAAMAVGGWLVALSTTSATATFWYYLRFVAFSVAPVTNFTFALEFIGRGRWLTRWSVAALLAVPLVTTILLLTDPAFVIRPTFAFSGGVLVWDFKLGPWFVVHAGYNYAMLGASLFLLVLNAVRARGVKRLHAGLMVAGMLAPILVDAISTAHVIPRNWALLLMPAALTLMGAVFALNILRYRLLALPPLALRIVNSITDPLYVEDGNGLIVFVNDALSGLAGRPKERLLGARIADLMPDASLTDLESEQSVVDASGAGRTFTAHRNHYVEKGGAEFTIGVLREITERKKIEAERERLIAKLQTALAQVKTLTGLLPVCAWCKKIRDDGGYWQEVEAYVTIHSNAQVTSSLCPDCKQSHFPEVGEKVAPPALPASPPAVNRTR